MMMESIAWITQWTYDVPMLIMIQIGVPCTVTVTGVGGPRLPRVSWGC